MSDKELVRKLIAQGLYALERVWDSFDDIADAEAFLGSREGMMRFESIIVNLGALGENLKRIDRLTSGDLFASYPNIPWSEMMRLRDVIAHNYFDMDAFILYGICQDYLRPVESALRQMLQSFYD